MVTAMDSQRRNSWMNYFKNKHKTDNFY